LAKLSYNILKPVRKALGIKFYSDYIKEISDNWWSGNHIDSCKEGLSICIDTVPRHDDTNEKWQCCPYWQRRLTNKLTAREFAIKCDVPVPDLYWYGKHVDDIPFDRLPSEYVIKTSFGASAKQVIPIKAGTNLFNNEQCCRDMIKEYFRPLMAKVSPYGYIMIEKLLSSENSDLAMDYKVFVFNGIAQYITVVNRLKKESWFYDRNWKQVTEKMHEKYSSGAALPRPALLKELIDYSERLGHGYGNNPVRIDFYITQKGCFFGEFTATPSGGTGFSLHADRLFGKLCGNIAEQV